MRPRLIHDLGALERALPAALTMLRPGGRLGVIAMTHHERWDGTGYPHRLHEEQIPLSGRIVAVADVFDALTHERPYKNAWSVQQAVQEILRLAGRQFDPQIVEAFARVDHSSLLMTPQRHLKAVAG